MNPVHTGRQRVFPGLLLLSFLVLPATAQQTQQVDYTIALESRQFLPPEDLSFLSTVQLSPPGLHAFLQFFDNPDAREGALLAARGIRLLHFIGNDAWFAFVPSSLSLGDPVFALVRFIGEILPTDKFPPRITTEGVGPWAVNPDGSVNLSVRFFGDVTVAKAEQVVNSTPGLVAILGKVTSPDVYISITARSSAAVHFLAGRDEVQWVEEVSPPPAPGNDRVRANIGLPALRAANPNLLGLDVNVAVFDDGDVDRGHFDFQTTDGNAATTRVTVVDNMGNNNHATHVAGTLGGDGSRSAARGGTPNQWEGVARAVRIFSYSFRGDQFKKHEDAVQNRGVNISNNSWGVIQRDLMGSYTNVGARQYDQLVRGAAGDRVSIAFIVHNQRNKAVCTAAPAITFGCITPPGTAKNTISVGAINSDNDTMTTFSGWGPTRDGRIKPDVVGPGCRSTVPDNANGFSILRSFPPVVGPPVPGQGPDGVTSSSPGNTYLNDCGTSMASPAVAGAGALLKQEFRSLFRRDPLPSSIKALLVDGAVDLQREAGGRPVAPARDDGPDYTTGFGRVDIDSSVRKLQNREILEGTIRRGEVHVYPFTVPAEAQTVKVTLAWDDLPGPPTCNALNARCLQNDLDLVLMDPNGRRWFPWVLDPANPRNPATRGGCNQKMGRVFRIGNAPIMTSCDDRNNVEVVEVSAALGDVIVPGVWRAGVIGFGVVGFRFPGVPAFGIPGFPVFGGGTQSYSLSSIVPAARVTSITGSVTRVGLVPAPGKDAGAQVGLMLKFDFDGPVDLSHPAASVTMHSFVDEPGGAGELVAGSDQVSLAPIRLPARPGGNPAGAFFETPRGAIPKVGLEVQFKQPGLFDFRLKVDRATIPAFPRMCTLGSALTTNLATTFTLDDGANPAFTVTTVEPWRCTDLIGRDPRKPRSLRVP